MMLKYRFTLRYLPDPSSSLTLMGFSSQGSQAVERRSNKSGVREIRGKVKVRIVAFFLYSSLIFVSFLECF